MVGKDSDDTLRMSRMIRIRTFCAYSEALFFCLTWPNYSSMRCTVLKHAFGQCDGSQSLDQPVLCCLIVEFTFLIIENCRISKQRNLGSTVRSKPTLRGLATYVHFLPFLTRKTLFLGRLLTIKLWYNTRNFLKVVVHVVSLTNAIKSRVCTKSR